MVVHLDLFFNLDFRNALGHSGPAKKDSPIDILKKRFASGQITKEQYLDQEAILEKDTGKRENKL